MDEVNELCDARQALEGEKADAERLGAPRVEARCLDGVAWRTIVDESRDGEYDLIVIGSHGRTGLTRALMGSVAERVVRHAPCLVLVIRAAPRAAA